MSKNASLLLSGIGMILSIIALCLILDYQDPRIERLEHDNKILMTKYLEEVMKDRGIPIGAKVGQLPK